MKQERKVKSEGGGKKGKRKSDLPLLSTPYIGKVANFLFDLFDTVLS